MNPWFSVLPWYAQAAVVLGTTVAGLAAWGLLAGAYHLLMEASYRRTARKQREVQDRKRLDDVVSAVEKWRAVSAADRLSRLEKRMQVVERRWEQPPEDVKLDA